MSEIINTHDNRAVIRWKLLTSASALALTVSFAGAARAEDADRPLIWIELGGQAENISGQGEAFAPPFLAANPNSSVIWKGTTPFEAQKLPVFNFGEEAKVTFQPENSDWVFSAAVRYGRSASRNKPDHQTHGVFHEAYKYGVASANAPTLATERFADTQAHHSEGHVVLDFQAGKDVGLGMFGKDASSILNLGVRFAQFSSRETFDIRARPDGPFKYSTFAAYGFPSLGFKLPNFHVYHATGFASRSFRGVGPSLAWNGSVPFAGNAQDGEMTFDWGVNAAVLFGKQKAKTHHQSSGYYEHKKYHASTYNHPSVPLTRSRSVTVPNVGGFAGLSFVYPDAKISIGYRADFFFGAMDGGVDARKSQTLGFKGPFASVSFGLGD